METLRSAPEVCCWCSRGLRVQMTLGKVTEKAVWLRGPWASPCLPPDLADEVEKGPTFSSVQSLNCVWLCDPMDCSTPGFPVHHQLPELAQTCPLGWWCHPTISSSVVTLTWLWILILPGCVVSDKCLSLSEPLFHDLCNGNKDTSRSRWLWWSRKETESLAQLWKHIGTQNGACTLHPEESPSPLEQPVLSKGLPSATDNLVWACEADDSDHGGACLLRC